MLDRIRQLIQGKANKPSRRTRQPLDREGAEGDFVLARLKDGIFVFFKGMGKWLKAFHSRTSLIPDRNKAYSLGSQIKRWKDIFLARGSIYIGDTKELSARLDISGTGENVKLRVRTPSGNVVPDTSVNLSAIEGTDNVVLTLTDAEYGSINLTLIETDASLEISDGATFTVVNQNDEADSETTHENETAITTLEDRVAALEALVGSSTILTPETDENPEVLLSSNPTHTRIDNRTEFDVLLRRKIQLTYNNFAWFKDEYLGAFIGVYDKLLDRLRPSNNPRYVTAEEFNAFVSYFLETQFEVDPNSIAASGAGTETQEATFDLDTDPANNTTYQLDIPAGSTFTTASEPYVTNPNLSGYGLFSQINDGYYSVSDTGLITVIAPDTSGFTAGQTIHISNYSFFNPSETQPTDEELDNLGHRGFTILGHITFAQATDKWTYAGHGLTVGDSIKFTSQQAAPTQYYKGLEYYVVFVDGNDFQLSYSEGGTVINGSQDSLAPDYYNRSWLAINKNEGDGRYEEYSQTYQIEGEEFPLVEGENYTSGVCIIGGEVSGHTNFTSCAMAGGVWQT